MFQTLRARLIGMSIAVATLSLLGLSLVCTWWYAPTCCRHWTSAWAA